jgi:hypothetical protein
VAFATQPPIRARRKPTPGRIGAVFIAAEVTATAVAIAVIVLAIDQPSDERCESGGNPLVTSALALIFAVATIGGVVLAAVIADARRHGGTLVWHMLAAPTALVLPYVVAAALLFFLLTCSR